MTQLTPLTNTQELSESLRVSRIRMKRRLSSLAESWLDVDINAVVAAVAVLMGLAAAASIREPFAWNETESLADVLALDLFALFGGGGGMYRKLIDAWSEY